MSTPIEASTFVTVNGQPSENALKVKEWFEQLAEGDLSAIRDSGTLDKNLHIHEPDSLPVMGGHFHGYTGFFDELMPIVFEGAFEIAIEDQRFLDCGDVVVSDMTVVWKSKRNGSQIRMPYLEKFTFEDGRVVGVHPHPHDGAALVDFIKSQS